MTGKIKMNGEKQCLEYKVKNGDELTHSIHRHEPPVTGEAIEIIANEKDMLIVNKPSSIPVIKCHSLDRFIPAADIITTLFYTF
jgi:tRNA pseudouridine synthase 9